MSRTLTDILVERERLLARCAQQRIAVAAACDGLAGPAAVVDRIAALGRSVARHPLAVVAVMASVVALRGRSLIRLSVRSIGLWRLVLRLRSLVQLFRS